MTVHSNIRVQLCWPFKVSAAACDAVWCCEKCKLGLRQTWCCRVVSPGLTTVWCRFVLLLVLGTDEAPLSVVKKYIYMGGYWRAPQLFISPVSVVVGSWQFVVCYVITGFVALISLTLCLSGTADPAVAHIWMGLVDEAFKSKAVITSIRKLLIPDNEIKSAPKNRM